MSHTVQQLREYADSLERADIHDDLGLSMLHTDAADLLRWAADYLEVAVATDGEAVPINGKDTWGRLCYCPTREDVIREAQHLIGLLQANRRWLLRQLLNAWRGPFSKEQRYAVGVALFGARLIDEIPARSKNSTPSV